MLVCAKGIVYTTSASKPKFQETESEIGMTILEFIKATVVTDEHEISPESSAIVIHKHGTGNFATKADLAIEQRIKAAIAESFPTDAILSEESKSPAGLRSHTNIWFVDPLDGTTNAAHGLPLYATSLAFMQEGEVVAGGVYDIPNQALYWAEKGKGAWLQAGPDTQPTQLRIEEVGLSDALVCTGSPYAREDFLPNWRRMDKVHGAGARLVMLGSAVVASCYVAQGRLSLYYERGLKPWDVAAVSLIVREAGGVATCMEGTLDIFSPKTFVVGNERLVNEFLAL